MVPTDSDSNGLGPISWRLHQHESEQVFGFGIANQALTLSCEKSPTKSSANEDSTLILQVAPDCIVLAVADGVGGLRGGELASEIALATLEKSIRERLPDQSIRTAIVDGIELANRQILDSNIAGASTIAIAVIEGNRFRPFHVGDSMVLLTSNRGRNKFLTIPHSPVGMAVEAGLLEEAAAMHHEQRHLVSNVIGSESMRIEIGVPTVISARDTLLLASDGLFDNLRSDEVAKLICRGNLEKAHVQMVARVRQQMVLPQESLPSKPDDLSVICFRLFGGDGQKSFQEIAERPEV